MICPHCGKMIPNEEVCQYCGMSTEFVQRTDFQSTGSCRVNHTNEWEQEADKSIPVIPSHSAEKTVPIEKQTEGTEDTPQTKNTSVLAVFVVVLAILVILLSTLTFYLVKELETVEDLHNQNEPADVETFTEDTVTECELGFETTVAAEYQETTEDKTSEQLEIMIQFDLNPNEQMKFFMAGQYPPPPIHIDEEIPQFHNIMEWKFIGWNTSADGSGVAVEVGNVVKDLPLSGDLTLYAQWLCQRDEDIPVG